MILDAEQKIQLFDGLKDWKRQIPRRVIRKVLRLSNGTELARRSGRSFPSLRYHVRLGHVPGPSFRIGRVMYWTAGDAKAVEMYLRSKYRKPRRSKFTADQQADMRRRWRGRQSQRSIAGEYGCSQSLVSRIVRTQEKAGAYNLAS